MPPRHRIINNGDELRSLAISLEDIASLDEWNAHGLEIARGYVANLDLGLDSAGLRILAFDDVAVAGTVAGERQLIYDSRCPHPWHLAHSIEKTLVSL